MTESANPLLATSPAPAAMQAQGYTSRMVNATDVRVGMIRILGGEITEVRTTKSGKSIYVTNGIGAERLAPTTRIACWVKP